MNIYTTTYGAYSHYIASAQLARRRCTISAFAVHNLSGGGAQLHAEYSQVSVTSDYAMYPSIKAATQRQGKA